MYNCVRLYLFIMCVTVLLFFLITGPSTDFTVDLLLDIGYFHKMGPGNK